MAQNKTMEFDPFCDPENPRKIQFDNIVSAAKLIAGHVDVTPCLPSKISDKLGLDLFYKMESMQRTGCFKVRGVTNTLLRLSNEQKRYGVICAALGNHGVSMAHATKRMNIPCIIVMPVNAPNVKVLKCRASGAKVMFYGHKISESITRAMIMRKDKKMLFISGFDHPNVIEGQGTVALEILDQLGHVDAVLVPVGGGGLITGVATVIKELRPGTLVYGISTDKTNTMAESLKKKMRVRTSIELSLADGLSFNTVGVNCFHSIQGLIDRMITVKEDWVAKALATLTEHEMLVAEGAGAVCLAAILAGAFPNLKGKRVAAIISGGNVDCNILSRALERGLGAEGRLIKFRAIINDQVGAGAELCHRIAQSGATMRDFNVQCCWMTGGIFHYELIIICETKGWDHSRQIMEYIKKHYKNTYFLGMEEQAISLAVTCRGPCMPQPEQQFGM